MKMRRGRLCYVYLPCEKGLAALKISIWSPDIYFGIGKKKEIILAIKQISLYRVRQNDLLDLKLSLSGKYVFELQQQPWHFIV